MGHRTPQLSIGLVLFLSSLLVTPTKTQTTFDLKCHPFQNLEFNHSIDTSCPSSAGNATPNTSGHALQNIAKNNFCAKGQAVDIKHADLLQLQSETEKNSDYKNWNDKNLPANRNPVH